MRTTKTSTRILLAVGIVAASFPLFMKTYISLPDGVDGFLRGFGLTLIAGAIFMNAKKKREIC
jgi:hypothetical protein